MDDQTLITKLGGPARLAELLGYDKSGGVQRVDNWRRRGIPARVKLARPDLFLQMEGRDGIEGAPEVAANDATPGAAQEAA